MKKTIVNVLLGLTLALAVWSPLTVLAARNSTGNYTLPSTWNPVVSGTPITKDWANGTLSDLATEVTSSLDRSGRGGMLAPLRTPYGSAAAPAHSFSSEPSTGMYLDTVNDLGIAVNGQRRLRLTNTAITAHLPVSLDTTLAVGGASTFSLGNLYLTSTAAQGVYRTGGSLFLSTTDANGLILQTNGTTRWVVNGSNGNITPATTSQSITSGALTLNGGALTLSQSAAQAINKSGGSLAVGTTDSNTLTFKTAGTTRVTLDTSGNVNLAGGKVTGVSTPSAGTDAANKDYVDAHSFSRAVLGTDLSLTVNRADNYLTVMGTTTTLGDQRVAQGDCWFHVVKYSNSGQSSGIIFGVYVSSGTINGASIEQTWRDANGSGSFSESQAMVPFTGANFSTPAYPDGYLSPSNINGMTSVWHVRYSVYGSTGSGYVIPVVKEYGTDVYVLKSGSVCTWNVI